MIEACDFDTDKTDALNAMATLANFQVQGLLQGTMAWELQAQESHMQVTVANNAVSRPTIIGLLVEFLKAAVQRGPFAIGLLTFRDHRATVYLHNVEAVADGAHSEHMFYFRDMDGVNDFDAENPDSVAGQALQAGASMAVTTYAVTAAPGRLATYEIDAWVMHVMRQLMLHTIAPVLRWTNASIAASIPLKDLLTCIIPSRRDLNLAVDSRFDYTWKIEDSRLMFVSGTESETHNKPKVQIKVTDLVTYLSVVSNMRLIWNTLEDDHSACYVTAKEETCCWECTLPSNKFRSQTLLDMLLGIGAALDASPHAVIGLSHRESTVYITLNAQATKYVQDNHPMAEARTGSTLATADACANFMGTALLNDSARKVCVLGDLTQEQRLGLHSRVTYPLLWSSESLVTVVFHEQILTVVPVIDADVPPGTMLPPIARGPNPFRNWLEDLSKAAPAPKLAPESAPKPAPKSARKPRKRK